MLTCVSEDDIESCICWRMAVCRGYIMRSDRGSILAEIDCTATALCPHTQTVHELAELCYR